MNDVQPSWRTCFINGFAPSISTAGLKALKQALLTDDQRLLQGATTCPAPLMATQDFDCECACPIGYCGMVGDELKTVGQIEEYFSQTCFDADQRLGEAAACRYFLNFVDDTPREQMRLELLEVVDEVLEQRIHGLPPVEESPTDLHRYQLNAKLEGIRVDGNPVG